MATRDALLKEPELVKWWVTVCHDDRFEKLMTYAFGIVIESAPTRDQLIGMKLLEHALSTMTDNDPAPFSFPTPGLEHDPDRVPLLPQHKSTKKGK